MPDDKKPVSVQHRPRGDFTIMRDERDAALAKAELLEKDKTQRWQTIREFITGPNLKYLVFATVVLAAFAYSAVTGMGFSATATGVTVDGRSGASP